jgi:hypothetical protein
MFELVDGLEANLSPSAPREARLQLAEARLQIRSAGSCERRLNVLAESAPCFRRAANRYLKPKVDRALRDAVRVLQRADRVLRQAERRNRSHNATSGRLSRKLARSGT